MSVYTSQPASSKENNAKQGQSANTSHTAPSKETSTKQGQYLPPTVVPPTNYKLVKDGWGSRPNFQGSYLLGMDPEGIEESNRILDALREGYMEWRKASKVVEQPFDCTQGFSGRRF